MKSLLFAAAFTLALALPATANSGDKTEVLAAADRLFRAMEHRDMALAKTAMHPDGRISRMVGTEAGATRFSKAESFFDRLATGTDLYQERLINPQVSTHENIAAIWSHYQFFINGDFSHCGMEILNLIKTEAGWRVTNLAYNVVKGDYCKAQYPNMAWQKDAYVITE